MRLSAEQLRQFDEDGYLFLPGCFSEAEVAVLRDEAEHIYATDRREVWREKTGAPRTAFAAHTYNEAFCLLGHHPRLIRPVEQVFGEQLYMHQYKINAKAAFEGDVWQWHQDYGTWARDDGMPEPRAMNIAVFIDEVMPINGPLMLVPRSHKHGVLSAGHDLDTTSYPLWTLDNDTVTRLVDEGGIVAPTGKPGAVLMFHGNLVHASAPNITPYPRRIVYLTLCAVSNYIRKPTRPEWIAHRDFAPIEPVLDSALLDYARAYRAAAEVAAVSLHRLARKRVSAGRPVRVGLIGAGKFGSMFLNQVPTMPGVEVPVIADLDPERGRATCRTVGWDAARIARTRFVASGAEACADPAVEVVVEATGSPPAGIAHARAAIAAGKHIVMVNVEADVLAGPLLAEEARARDVVYSLAYGDQPALTCELVDWARACGFEVVAAGKGTKYLPAYHAVTPADVWPHYGLSPEDAARGGMNPQMFNSFLDGTKSAIEMAAIANATGLGVPHDGLHFPPCGVDDLPQVLRGAAAGGVLEQDGMVEVVSSLERDGRPVFRDLRWGVYVVLKAPNEYARACFNEYGLKTDPRGWYAAMYKPYHLIGLELGMSVLSAALRGEPTGQPQGWRGDVVAVAKRDLRAGETLDREGGYTVWGKLVPAARSLAEGALPIGLAHKVPLRRDIAAGETVRWTDVEIPDSEAVRARRDMERRFAAPAAIAAQ